MLCAITSSILSSMTLVTPLTLRTACAHSCKNTCHCSSIVNEDDTDITFFNPSVSPKISLLNALASTWNGVPSTITFFGNDVLGQGDSDVSDFFGIFFVSLFVFRSNIISP